MCFMAAGSILSSISQRRASSRVTIHPADILAQIPAQLNGMNLMDPDHLWFGTALSGFGIITNERVRQGCRVAGSSHVGRPD